MTGLVHVPSAPLCSGLGRGIATLEPLSRMRIRDKDVRRLGRGECIVMIFTDIWREMRDVFCVCYCVFVLF